MVTEAVGAERRAQPEGQSSTLYTDVSKSPSVNIILPTISGNSKGDFINLSIRTWPFLPISHSKKKSRRIRDHDSLINCDPSYILAKPFELPHPAKSPLILLCSLRWLLMVFLGSVEGCVPYGNLFSIQHGCRRS